MGTPRTASGRAGTVTRGLGALLALGLLLVGLPALLVAVVGVPTSLPSAALLFQRLTGFDDGTVFVAAAATVGWLAWAVFTISTLVEAAAMARHGLTRRTVAGPGPGGLAGPRRLAAHLLTAVAVLAGAGQPHAGSAGARPAVTAVALAGDRPPLPAPLEAAPIAYVDVPPANAGSVEAAPSARPATAVRGVEVVVRRGDTLWALAEQHLGAGQDWPQIAHANYGRPQPDGRTLTDAHWIYPGWRLIVPPPVAATNQATMPGRQPVPGNSQRGAGRAPIQATLPSPRATPPSLQAMEPSAHPQTARSAPAGPGSAASPTAGHRLPLDMQPPDPRRPHPPDLSSGPSAAPASAPGTGELLAASLAGGGLLAAGLLAELHRRRRRQSRARPSGSRVATPGPAAARAEAAIRAAADIGSANSLQAVLRFLATPPVPGEGSPAIHIASVQLSPTALTVGLTGPQPPPPGWAAAADTAWRLDPPGRVDLLAAPPPTRVDPLPGLVTAGTTGDGDYLLLNMAAVGVAIIGGPDPAQVDRQLQTMALELATAPWGGPWFELATVGLPALNGFDRAVPYPDLPAALTALRARVDDADAACLQAGAADVITARTTDPDDDRLQPLALISTRAPSATELADLHALTSRLPGLAGALLPAPDNAGAAATLQLTDRGTLRIPALAAELQPAALTPADMTAVLALFATADAPAQPARDAPANLAPELDALPHLTPDPGPAEPEETPDSADDPEPALPDGDQPAPTQARLPVADAARPTPGGDGGTGPAEPPRPALLVRLLGPPDVTGSARPVTTSHGLELLLALALRGEAALDSRRLADLLGADGDLPVTAAYRQQIVSRVRAQLGPASDGRPQILYNAGAYRLHPEVGTDLDLFRRFTARGTRVGLRAALALVRGPALDGVDYWWLPELAGAAQAEIRAVVVDAAERLSTLDLAAGDPTGAVNAACAGLRVDPDERLYRALIRAHAAAGNLTGVAQAWQECLAVLTDLGVPTPHPQTVAVHREALNSTTSTPVNAGRR